MKKVFVVCMAFLLIMGMTTVYAVNTEATTSVTQNVGGQPNDLSSPDGNPPDGMVPPGGMTPPDGMAPPDGIPGGIGGGSMTESSGVGATTLSADTAQSGAQYASSTADENALRIEGGATVSITDVDVTKAGDASNSDNSAFYGLNAAVLVRDGATLNLTGGIVSSDANGGNGVFAYGTGMANITGMTIRTSQGNSGGIMLAGGGTVNASELDIETQGGSSAAIRTDRGGGKMTVSGGTYVTNGIGSPAVYSTAVVSVSNATLTANNSESVVVEGKNSVSLTDCVVTGNMTSSAGGAGENLHCVMIYQSMSGDADVGRSDLSMTGGSLTSLNGDTFYITNTSCTVELSGVEIVNADGVLLRVSGNTSSRGWGREGANGGVCDLTATGQMLDGQIIVDEISSLNLVLQQGSILTGTVNPDGSAGPVAVTLDDTSTWKLTADAYIARFDGNLDNVDTNGFQLYVDGAVVK